jgi:hypothetical protein
MRQRAVAVLSALAAAVALLVRAAAVPSAPAAEVVLLALAAAVVFLVWAAAVGLWCSAFLTEGSPRCSATAVCWAVSWTHLATVFSVK